MTRAFLFGGQGTEVPRMGVSLAAELPEARALLRYAGELAGIDAEHVLTTGGLAFSRTSVIQPLLTAVGLGVAAALAARGITPAFVAGHSLGELAAWSVAGAFDAKTAIKIAARRGAAMERESTQRPGGMIAVAGQSEDAVRELVRLAEGSVVIAAHNAAQEWTLSGDRVALDAIAARTAVTRLPVGGAWHSPAMTGAVADVREAVGQVAISGTGARVVCNRTGEVAPRDADVGELLAGQLVRPVQWVQTLATLAAAGVTEYVVLGPSKLMRSLVLKAHGARVPVVGVETPDDVRGLAR